MLAAHHFLKRRVLGTVEGEDVRCRMWRAYEPTIEEPYVEGELPVNGVRGRAALHRFLTRLSPVVAAAAHRSSFAARYGEA
jgi:hypothetical protein